MSKEDSPVTRSLIEACSNVGISLNEGGFLQFDEKEIDKVKKLFKNTDSINIEDKGQTIAIHTKIGQFIELEQIEKLKRFLNSPKIIIWNDKNKEFVIRIRK